MNQKPDDILKLLQRSGPLSSAEKKTIAKTVQGAEKELNAKDRELQIEASLECVRVVALAMKQPADMLEICKMISRQLELLRVKEIRNVQTAIFNQDKGTYFNYEYYTKHDTTVFTETDYKNHPVHLEFADRMLKGGGEVFIRTITGKELPDWIQYQKTTNVFIDSFLESASSLTYYWYSLGPVALGMSTYKPLTNEEIELFKRFKNVFELSYRRYLDIAQAEAQARESQIQLALERVRARTMAMQKSDELSETVFILFQQFRELGENPDQATIGIMNENEHVIEYWVTMYGSQTNQVFKFSIDEPHVTNKIYSAWKEGKKSLVIDLAGKELLEFMTYRAGKGGAAVNPNEKRRVINVAFFSKGLLNVQSNESRSEESIKLLERFAVVFEQTYTRFLDLQKAEMQSHEAQIEASLERVRGRAMAMHSSSDLSAAAAMIFTELKKLGIKPIRSGVVLVSKESRQAQSYSAIPGTDGEELALTGGFNLSGNRVLEQQYQSWLRKENYFTSLKGEDLKSYYKAISSGGMNIFNRDNIAADQEEFGHWLMFSEGFLFAWSGKKYSGGEIKILDRFKNIVELTFRRYLDLKKAEAQAREAQIELALERVRARTMAMQKSEELSETARMLFQQFNDLGANPIQITIGIYNEEENVIEFRSTDPFGAGAKVDYAVKGSLEEPTLLKKIYADWKEGKKSTVIALEGKELSEWVKYRINMSGVPDDRDYSGQRRVVYVGFFSKGMLSVSSIDDPSRESVQLLERFAGVFNLTYTRFLDLKQAEAQLRESQIEAALERVRSRTMGMQKSEELKEVIQVVYDQFAHLNINIGHTGFVMDYKARDDYAIWIADPLGVPSQVTIPYFDSVYYNRFNEAKEKGEDFFAINLTFEEKNKFYQKLFEYVPGLPEESKEFYFSCPGLAASNVLLENVCLYIENFSGTPYTDEENSILMRFGKVFQQTYTRFLDLQKAEAQARESQIQLALERVRARTMAMQRSDELKEAAALLFQQVKSLGVPAYSCGYNIWEKDDKEFTSWMSTQDGSIISGVPNIPLTEDANFIRYVESKQNSEPFFVLELRGKRMQEHYEYLKTIPAFKVYFDYAVSVGFDLPETQIHHLANFSHGNLLFITLEPCPEYHDVFKRFAAVFEQTYTRFLDLQKAEAQARESQIEAALEKVRGRAMAMQKSEDLGNAIAIVFEELNKLNIGTLRCGISIINKEKRTTNVWTTVKSGTHEAVQVSGDESMDIHPLMQGAYNAWLELKDFSYVLEGEDQKVFYKALAGTNLKLPDFPAEIQAEAQRQYLYVSHFPTGGLYAFKQTTFSEEEKSIVRRFGEVFSLTYTRFNDLKQAEAQAREAQIEAGLERVRSRTLAMHSSEELVETAAVVFKQLINLGIEPNRLYIAIIKDDPDASGGDAEFWITDEAGTKVSSGFTANMNGNPSFKKMFEGWKDQRKSLTIDMQGEELNDYVKYLSELNVPFTVGLSQKRRVQTIAFFSQGFIGIASPDSQPPETTQLLERFASVFNLTYTRFSDLQLAEAQAKQAQMEAAMERVRGRALAMQQPEELMDVAETLRREMGMLGVAEIETGTIFIFDEATETVQFGFTARDFSKPEKAPVTDTITIDLNKTWAGREFLKFFRLEENRMTLHMEGIERKEWIEDIYSQSPKANNYFGENIQDRTYHLLKFSNGAVAAVTDGLLLSDESWDLLSRASSVFSLAYSRFKDLTKARVDLQNLKDEKKRSDSLLLNILPEEIANELKQFGKSYARKHEQVTILFADIKNFSSIAENLSAQELVTQLDECFRAFDHIVDKHGLEKIKTVGDAYVCACGLPKPVADNAVKAVRAALDMLSFIKGFAITKTIQDLPAFEFRVGINTGSVITGVVGLKKFTYDIWGDAVNMAARMEQHGEAGRINISDSTYQLIKDKFACTPRGKIEAKNKGEVEMYFVERPI